MSNGENRRNGPEFRTGPLITSAVMVGAGTLIALTGLAVGFQHCCRLPASGSTRWRSTQRTRQAEVDPGQGGDGGRDVGMAERGANRSLATARRRGSRRVARGTRADLWSLVFHPSRVGRGCGVTDGLGAT
jgi:hypothetical protein